MDTLPLIPSMKRRATWRAPRVDLDLHHSMSLEVNDMYKRLRTGTDRTDRISALGMAIPRPGETSLDR